MPADDKSKEKGVKDNKSEGNSDSEVKKLVQEKSEEKQSSISESSESEVKAKFDLISFFKKKQNLRRQILPYSIALLALGFLIYWWKLIVSILLWFILIPCVIVGCVSIYSAIRAKDKKEKKFSLNTSSVCILLGSVSFFLIPSGINLDDTAVRDKIMEEAIDVDKLLEKLDNDDDVQNVYHTMDESE